MKRSTALLCSLFLLASTSARGASFTVTSASDSGAGSLRDAITKANAAGGADVIKFAISATQKIITVATPLPAITGPVTIDGTTQAGYNGVPLVEINGANAGNGSIGLAINGGASTLRGLRINGFDQSGITVSTLGGNVVEACYLGLAADGDTLKANFRAAITLKSANNRIGGTTAAQRNVIAGSVLGVYIVGPGKNTVAGNYIGLNAAGNADRSNGCGVWIESGANTIGGVTAASRNVILGSSNPSIYVPDVAGPGGNIIQHNYIATNAAGKVGLGAGGINLQTANNQVLDNLIAGNRGLSLSFANATGNIVRGNTIGLAADGATPLSNNAGGISILRADGNIIGGTSAADRNVIATNSAGIDISSAKNCVVQGNYIGLKANGNAAALPTLSAGSGISLTGTDGTLIGGTVAGARNVIGNCTRGLVMVNDHNDVARGNFFGTDRTGMKAIPNDAGVFLVTNFGLTASDNTVGGTTAAARNVISGNNTGVNISGGESEKIQGNYIGVAADGKTPLPNLGDGIDVSQANNNLIGGTTAGSGNLIAYNGLGANDPRSNGVRVFSGTGNSILGNSIFGNVGRIGIELDSNDDTVAGVTPNDDGDADTGANDLQNYPVISGVSSTATDVTIDGTLNSVAKQTYRVEFFGTPAPDPSGYGPGKTFLGATNVLTAANGNGSFHVTFPISGNPGAITATATAPDGSTSEFSAAFGARLQNISTRLRVLTGENVSIGGFIITGATPKRIIIRGLGPSLSGSVGAEALANPTLELAGSGVDITNDDWKETQQAEIEATGIPPSKEAESAIIATLAPGGYTATLRGKNDTTGIGLVEVYDLDLPTGPRLANISTRGFVDTGANVMIGGFIVGPSTSGAIEVIVRAIGPSLSSSGGITNALQDPTLELYDGSGTKFATNKDWQDTQKAQIEATGIPPTDSRESAYIGSFAPGGYTAIVRGNGDTTGVALVEAYDLSP